jgi:hypothetical protein
MPWRATLIDAPLASAVARRSTQRMPTASVMPAIVSGNLNAPMQMIAAGAVDFIPGKSLFPAKFTDFHFQ